MNPKTLYKLKRKRKRAEEEMSDILKQMLEVNSLGQRILWRTGETTEEDEPSPKESRTEKWDNITGKKRKSM